MKDASYNNLKITRHIMPLLSLLNVLASYYYKYVVNVQNAENFTHLLNLQL